MEHGKPQESYGVFSKQAITADPSYAPAYAELANSYSMGAFFLENLTGQRHVLRA
jgi:hypothetical protein